MFCRFSGCNLWTGREEDRADAICQFCDTDFFGVGPDGGKFATAEALADAVIVALWLKPKAACAGLQKSLSSLPAANRCCNLRQFSLIDAMHAHQFEIAVETNGTQPAPAEIDWICMSPKARASLVLTHGNELKLVYPQKGAEPERYAALDFAHFFLQPMDGPDIERNTRAALEYCLAHPQWNLSLQTHKLLGLR